MDKRAYYAAEKGTYRLYSIYTDNFTLCDGAELIEQPEFSSDFSGLPYKYTRINTTSGFYALYYVEPWAKWYCYGPFKEYVPVMAGYLFKDIRTGKWGVGKYGEWTLDEYALDYLKRARLTPTKDILLPAQYEKIVSVLDSYRDAYWALGYKNKSDVRWYCYDGNQWYGFDIDGNSMEVNQTVLKQALNMPVQTSIKRNRNGMPNQRLGIEEASVFMISHSNSD